MNSNKEKKATILFFATFFFFALWGCKPKVHDANRVNWVDSVEIYKQQAMYGNGDAYLKLAYCYTYGLGVKKNDFMAINMAIMAQQYGGIKSISDYLDNTKKHSDLSVLLYVIECVKLHKYDEARTIGTRFKHDSGVMELIEGAIALDQGQEEEAIHFFDIAKKMGNPLGVVMLVCYAGINDDGMETADLFPFLYNVIANNYVKCYGIDEKYDPIVTVLYLMADNELCLDPLGAEYLLRYYSENKDGITPDSTHLKRLRILANKSKYQQNGLNEIRDYIFQNCNDSVNARSIQY